MESQLETLKAEDRNKILSHIKNLVLDEEQKMAEWDLAIDEHTAKYDMLFRNFFRYSFVVLLVLFIENSLRNLCYAVQDVKGSSRKVPNAQQAIWAEYKKYLRQEGLSVPESFWETINTLTKVRNCIVHSSGKVTGSKHEKDLRNAAKQGIGIQISDIYSKSELQPLYREDDMLVLETKYCRQIVEDVKQLLEQLCDAVPLHRIDWSSAFSSKHE
jgi:hypothetical protein